MSGYTGILSIVHAAFYGIGAYVTALMALNFNSHFIINIVCAVIVSGLLSVVIAFPSLRIHGDYFAIASFAFQIIIFSIMNNWVSLTGGPLGLPNIPQPNFFGITIYSHIGFLLLTYVFAIITFIVCHRLVNSPYGRVLKAIREDEIFALSLGKNVTRYKITIFIISAGLAAVAGCLYAYYITFIDPTSFTVMESIFIISIVIIGGTGNLWGSVIGAIMLVAVPELLRFIGLPSTMAANVRQILYGSLLVICMIFRPQGLMGDFVFEKKR